MTDAEQWPPRSPLKALLSSPSGRKKYREMQISSTVSMSPNKLLGSPSLLEKLRAARADRDAEFLEPQKPGLQDDDADEDEETLQLKLQAIEAKLRLKKLQQQKARDSGSVRPTTATSTTVESATSTSRVEVALSPTKRSAALPPRSPSRVTLGIDKGVNPADISLKRARTVNGGSNTPQNDRPQSRFLRPHQSLNRPSASSNSTPSTTTKSFSERMAEMRDRDKGQQERISAAQNGRASRFKLDKTEIDEYHTKAGLPSAIPSRNGDRPLIAASVRKEKDPKGMESQDQENRSQAQSRQLKHSRSLPSIRSTSPSKERPLEIVSAGNDISTDDEPKGDANLYESFSNTHLSTRILPHTFLKRTLPTDQFEIFTLPKLLKTVTSPAYQLSDEVTDYVVFAIIASRSSPRDHKTRPTEKNSTSSNDWEKKWDDGSMNRQKFIVMTLTDLKWTVDLFLFDTAVPRYYRLAPGTLIAILNPSIMPPKKGKEDTGAFSLAIHNGEDQILEIGTSKHLSYCQSKRKDGSQCGSWVDGSKTEICEWHLNAELDRARSKRMGVNSMGGFNGVRKKEQNFRHGFDNEAQSFYYAVGGTRPQKTKEQQWSFAPTHNSSLSTAKLLDSTNPDDPFIASGQMLERDKQDRLRKQMAAQEKEREIARRLGKLGHKGGAGGEYFRQRGGEARPSRTGVTHGPGVTKDDILMDKGGESRKRAADSVRLSPVKKKTRFLTSAGIKEAGRDSLGPGAGAAPLAQPIHVDEFDDDDDDDDLDIV